MSSLTPVRRPWSAPRVVAAFLTILCGVAGFAAGRYLDEPASGQLVAVLVLIAAAAAITAWIVARPPADPLRLSGNDALRIELDRARRHNRPFAMARFELAHPDPAIVVPGRDEDIAQATIRLIGATLRITDHAWLDDGDAVILLPESDRATAEGFAQRIRSTAPGHFTDRMGLAAFPDDGVTSGALLDVLERGMLGSAVPSPIGRNRVAAAAADLAAAANPLGAAEHLDTGVG